MLHEKPLDDSHSVGFWVRVFLIIWCSVANVLTYSYAAAAGNAYECSI